MQVSYIACHAGAAERRLEGLAAEACAKHAESLDQCEVLHLLLLLHTKSHVYCTLLSPDVWYAMQVLQSADVKARLQKNCAKYAVSLDQREVLHLLLRMTQMSNMAADSHVQIYRH